MERSTAMPVCPCTRVHTFELETRRMVELSLYVICTDMSRVGMILLKMFYFAWVRNDVFALDWK